MPLTLNCPKCRKPFRVRDDSVGGRVKCPTCAAILQVPATLSSASVASTASLNLGSAEVTSRTGKAHRAESLLEDLPGPGTHPGPPSLPGQMPPTQPIKQRREEPVERDRGSRGAETGPLPLPRKHSQIAKPKRRDDEVSLEQVVEDAAGWRRVRKGLWWVQVAYFLALLPAIGNFAVIAYTANKENKAPEQLKEDKGVLGKSMSLWDEIEYGYIFVIPAVVYLLVLMGRMSLLRVPESARTRGTASGLILLTLISFAALATYACSTLLPKVAGTDLPRDAGAIAWLVLIYFGLLTEAWYLLCLGQMGVPLRSTRTLRDTALSLLMLVVLIVGVLIANRYYPLLTSSPKLKSDEVLNTRMLEAGVYLVVAFVFVFRVTAITGIIRRAISRWMEENKETLQAVAE